MRDSGKGKRVKLWMSINHAAEEDEHGPFPVHADRSLNYTKLKGSTTYSSELSWLEQISFTSPQN